MNSQQLAFRLRYTDVVLTLIRLVVLLYMKLSEVNHVANRSMFTTLFNTLQSMDKEIVDKVLNQVCGNLNLVARRKSQMRLMQVYECLNLTKLPNLRPPGSAEQAQEAQRENKAAIGGGTWGLSGVP